jgi:hypothetical protein
MFSTRFKGILGQSAFHLSYQRISTSSTKVVTGGRRAAWLTMLKSRIVDNSQLQKEIEVCSY